MNQQSLMTVLGAYPAPKASDELMWQELRRAWDEERGEGKAQEISDAEAVDAQSLMAQRLERVLLTTRLSWSMR